MLIDGTDNFELVGAEFLQMTDKLRFNPGDQNIAEAAAYLPKLRSNRGRRESSTGTFL